MGQTRAMRLPLVFISHGAPTVALEVDDYAEALGRLGRDLGTPRAIVVMSAHWESPGSLRVTTSARPQLIYDFAGFPAPLYQMTYPAPGEPELAGEIVSSLVGAGLRAVADARRGWDHGVWIPLRLIFPGASTPVVQISLPSPASPADLMLVGRTLAPLRDRGVLLMCSGGIVHNLRAVRFGDKHAPPDAWAREFDVWFGERLVRRDLEAILAYRQDAPHARLALPTTEHFDPVFLALGASDAADRPAPVYEGIHYGNLSMRSFALRPREGD